MYLAVRGLRCGTRVFEAHTLSPAVAEAQRSRRAGLIAPQDPGHEFPNEGSHPWPVDRGADSWPRDHQGNPKFNVF